MYVQVGVARSEQITASASERIHGGSRATLTGRPERWSMSATTYTNAIVTITSTKL